MAQYKVKPINVPIINNGVVDGYFIAQVSYLADSGKLKGITIKPDAFIHDAGFKYIYGARDGLNPRSSKGALLQLTAELKRAVDARYEDGVVSEILLDEFGYLPADSFRAGRKTEETGGKEAGAKKHK